MKKILSLLPTILLRITPTVSKTKYWGNAMSRIIYTNSFKNIIMFNLSPSKDILTRKICLLSGKNRVR